jgi:hypothetical protein
MGIIVPFTGVTRSYDLPPPPACGGEGRGGGCEPQSDPGDENDSHRGLPPSGLHEPPRPQIIGLAGLKGCGKSTVAQHLAGEHGFARIRFAAPLKSMIGRLLDEMGIGHHQAWHLIEGDHKETPTPLFMGQTPRHAMQTLGTEWGRDLIGPDFWVACWRHMVERARLDHIAETCGGVTPIHVVAEDCRFPNEAAAIRALGGRVVWIDRPGLAATGHASENSLTAADCDAVIRNDGAILDLTQAVEAVL